MADTARENRSHIALVPSYGLGDGLLWLILAENLRRNGLRVTFYHDHINQLKDWLPNIEVKPFPVFTPDISLKINWNRF